MHALRIRGKRARYAADAWPDQLKFISDAMRLLLLHRGEIRHKRVHVADGEAVGDFVGLGVLLGFGLPVGRGVVDGSTRARLGLEDGVGDGLLADDVGVTGGELRAGGYIARTGILFDAVVDAFDAVIEGRN